MVQVHRVIVNLSDMHQEKGKQKNPNKAQQNNICQKVTAEI